MMCIAMMLSVIVSSSAWAEPFRERVQIASVQVGEQHPDIARRVEQMQPVKNRAGRLSFPGPELIDERAQVLIQNRLLFGADELPVRLALAMALDGQHRLPWSVIRGMPEALRTVLINGYKQHGEQDAIDAFEGALTDASVRVRAEAIRLLGYRSDLQSDVIERELRLGLSGQDADVRRFSVRSIAWRNETWGFEAISPLLSDGDARVRGAAVRALGNLDRKRAQAMSEIKALRADPNPYVTRPIGSLLEH